MNRRFRILVPAAVAALLLPGTGRLAGQEPAGPRSQEPDPDLVLELSGRVRPRFRLAFPATSPAAGMSRQAVAASREIDETLRGDLEESGVFELQGPDLLAVLALTGDQERDFELYRSLRNELLLTAEVKEEGDRLILEGKVFDLRSGGVIVGKRYRGTLAVARRIAHTLADEIILAVSGRRGLALTRIVFSSTRGGPSGTKEIYVMDYDGRGQRPITAHRSLSLSPVWSPGGEAVAYLSYFSGAPGLYLADLATGRKQPMVTDGTLNISPSFSPDGRRVVFSRTVGGGNTEIFVAAREGGELRRLTHSSGIDANPAWGPNGRDIAFTSSRSGSPQIYLMDAEGANLRRLSFEGSYNDGASWSPDGTRVVYSTRRGSTFEIALTNVVTLETSVLTGGGGSYESPCFSPDGRKIVFAWTRFGAGRSTQIYTMDLDGTGFRQLTTEGDNFSPHWSPIPE